MHPIKNLTKYKIGYSHGDKTFYSDFHLGYDIICKSGTPIYAPFDCKVIASVGNASGNMVYVYWDKYVMRCLHLRERAKSGNLKKGQVIGYTGNTGKSTNDHLHLDISRKPFNLNNRKNFIDPAKFEWEEKGEYMFELKRLKGLVKKYYDRAKLYANELNKVRGLYKKSLAEIKKLKGVK